MQRLILCNTYYQLIVATQLSLTQFSNDDVYLVISDHSKNTKNVVDRLEEQDVFKRVFFVKTKDLDYSKFNIKTFFTSVIPAIFGNSRFLKDLDLPVIDEMVYYNLSFSAMQFFAAIYKKNHFLHCSRMEESLLTYDVQKHDGIEIGRRYGFIIKARELLKKSNLVEKVKNFYCFQPDFYKGKLTPIKIESLTLDGKVKDILMNAFSVDLDDNDYREKFIFFTSVYDFEGEEPIGEYDLVCRIADLVGKDNLLVKTHPRDTRTNYEDNGFSVDKNSSIPWEVVQLSRDFSDKVFLTATSSSVLAGSFMSEKSPKTFFMHRCCKIDGNTLAQTSVDTIERLLSEELLKTVVIANDVKDILI